MKNSSDHIEAHNKIEAAMRALFNDKPFYAAISYNMSRVANEKLAAPFGLFFSKKGVELHYNPDKVILCTVKALQFMIEHSIAHLVHMHPIRREGREAEQWNTATDLVVNQIVKFPQGEAKVAEQAETIEKFGLPPEKTAEEYYEIIRKQSSKNNSSDEGEGGGNSSGNPKNQHNDDHSGWEEIGKEGVSKDLVKAITKQAIADAIKSCGNIPGEFQDVIDALFFESKIDWRDILSQFLATSQVTTKKQTWKRPNRRSDLLPGFKKEVTPLLLIGIDTSGSVSDADQKRLLNEVYNIMDQRESIIIVAGYDCRVHTVVRITNSNDECKIPNTNGGTDFNVLNDLAEQEQPDAIINLTDGYAPTPSESSFPYLWAFLKNHQDHPNYGESLVIDD